MNQDADLSWVVRKRVGLLILLGALILAILAVKSFNNGWFEPKTPLALNGQPALVYFSARGSCPCQMDVILAANAQLAAWPLAQAEEIPVFTVDFFRRSDLAEKYGVARPPALVLLDAQEQVVWKQDVGLSDEAPLNLIEAEKQINLVLPVGTR